MSIKVWKPLPASAWSDAPDPNLTIVIQYLILVDIVHNIEMCATILTHAKPRALTELH